MPSLRDSGRIVEGSVAQVAAGCELSFPLSLRDFLATPGCPFQHCVQLHLKILTGPNIPIPTMLARMREVYATAGIRVEIASRENLTAAVLGATNFTTLNDLDVGACKSSAISAEQTQLFQNQNNVPAGQRASEVVAYFVRTVTQTVPTNGVLNGCGAFPTGLPSVAIAQACTRWTLAHEVGHVMGLNHISGEHTGCPAKNPLCCSTPDFTRLMTGCSTNNIVGVPTLSQTEIDTMTNSTLALPS